MSGDSRTQNFEVHFDMIIAKEDMNRMVSQEMQDLPRARRGT